MHLGRIPRCNEARDVYATCPLTLQAQAQELQERAQQAEQVGGNWISGLLPILHVRLSHALARAS